MKRPLQAKAASFALVLYAPISACAGELVSKKALVSPEEDRWKFDLSEPGWMQGMKATVGILF